MLKLGAAEFREAYDALLAGLDPDEVARGVGNGSVMLCWSQTPAPVIEQWSLSTFAVRDMQSMNGSRRNCS
jgi:hypothetical protein